MVHPCLAGGLHNGSFLEMMEVGGGDLVLLRQIGTGMDVLESRAPSVTTPVLPASTPASAAPGEREISCQPIWASGWQSACPSFTESQHPGSCAAPGRGMAPSDAVVIVPLGAHLQFAIKTKILWGQYIDIFSLLFNKLQLKPWTGYGVNKSNINTLKWREIGTNGSQAIPFSWH